MMGCSVREAQARIDAHEFAEWVACDEIDPPGLARIELHLALLRQEVANRLRGKGEPPHKLGEFMLRFDSPRRHRDWHDIKTEMTAFAHLHNRMNRKRAKHGDNR